MKVIFIKDQQGGVKRGQIQDVSDGYAKNFLITKGFAQVATPEIQAKVAKEQKEADTKKQKEVEKLRNLKLEIEKRTFTMQVKVGDKGQIFSGVRDKDIAEAVSKKLDVSLQKNQVDLKKPLKETGKHKVAIHLFNGIVAQANIEVIGK